MNRIINLLRKSAHRRRERGIAAVEFALTIPILLLLLLGATDAAYMMIVSQRVDRISYTVTDIVTQSKTISVADLNNILLAAGQLMQPFTFGTQGIVIITALTKPTGGTNKICWQYKGGGSLARESKIGLFGSTPSMPSGLTLNDNEMVVVTEVYYVFTPMFLDAAILTEGDVYRTSVYKPRLSPLCTPPA